MCDCGGGKRDDRRSRNCNAVCPVLPCTECSESLVRRCIFGFFIRNDHVVLGVVCAGMGACRAACLSLAGGIDPITANASRLLNMHGPVRVRLLAVHGSIAALFGILLFVMLFTGTWSAAQESMSDWWRFPIQKAEKEPISIDSLLPIAVTYGVDMREAQIMLPKFGDSSVRFCTRQGCVLALDRVSGKKVLMQSSASIPTTLHKNFYAGFPGRIFISLFGIVLLILLIGGILLHGPRWRQALRLRRYRGLSVRLLDLHSLVGLWTTPWLALIGITGAMSGLGALGTVTLAPIAFPNQPSQVFSQLMVPSAPAASGKSWQHVPSLGAVLHDDARNYDDFIPQMLTVNHWGDANASMSIAGVTRGVPSTALFEQHLYRLDDGLLLHRATASERAPWVRAFIAVQPLHFAQYEWLPGARVWYGVHVLMGMAASVLAATGLYLWVRRHTHHQPRMGRFLMSCAVGVCGGLVLSVGLLLVTGQLQIVGYWSEAWSTRGFWGVWLGVIVIAFCVSRHSFLLQGLMITSGLVYFVAACLHAGTTAAAGTHNVFWLHDILLMLFGIALLRHVRIQGREV